MTKNVSFENYSKLQLQVKFLIFWLQNSKLLMFDYLQRKLTEVFIHRWKASRSSSIFFEGIASQEYALLDVISLSWDIGADILHVVLVILASSDRWDRSQSSYAITISNISWYYKIHWNGLKNRVDRDVWLFIQELLRKWAREHCKIPTLLVLLMRRWLAYHLVLVFHFVIFALANAF